MGAPPGGGHFWCFVGFVVVLGVLFRRGRVSAPQPFAGREENPLRAAIGTGGGTARWLLGSNSFQAGSVRGVFWGRARLLKGLE